MSNDFEVCPVGTQARLKKLEFAVRQAKVLAEQGPPYRPDIQFKEIARILSESL